MSPELLDGFGFPNSAKKNICPQQFGANASYQIPHQFLHTWPPFSNGRCLVPRHVGTPVAWHGPPAVPPRRGRRGPERHDQRSTLRMPIYQKGEKNKWMKNPWVISSKSMHMFTEVCFFSDQVCIHNSGFYLPREHGLYRHLRWQPHFST